MNIKDYFIVREFKMHDMATRVARLVLEGFEPFGSPFVHDDNYHQAMIIYQDPDDIEPHHMSSRIRLFPEIYMPLIQLVEKLEHPDARDSEAAASVAAFDLLCFGAGLRPEDYVDTTAEEWEDIYSGLDQDSDEE